MERISSWIWTKLMKKIKFIFFITSLMLIFNISGCVPVIYHQYEPIDVIDIYHNPIRHPEVVYIPRHRPLKLYRYNNFWYDEPYTRMLYMDFRGNVSSRKIPNSQLPKRAPARPMVKRSKKPKDEQGRRIIRKRIRNR